MRRLLSLTRHCWSFGCYDEDGKTVAYFSTTLYQHVENDHPAEVVLDMNNSDDVDWLERVRAHYGTNFELEVMDPDESGHVEVRYYTPLVSQVLNDGEHELDEQEVA